MPVVICAHCNSEFYVRPARIATGRGIFCSRKCQAQARSMKKQEAQQVCAFCGSAMQHTGFARRFCSQDCARASVLQRLKKYGRRCSVCHKKFFPVHITDRFCSVGCESLATQQLAAPSFDDPWESGAIKPDYYGVDTHGSTVYRMPDYVLGF